jgi:hypothetical protein
MAADFSQWPTKQEARQQLGGVPERTFDRWLSEHNVKVAYRKVTGRRPVPVVDPAGIALLQRDMMAPAPPASAVPAVQESPGMPARLEIPPQWQDMAATLLARLSTPPAPVAAPPLPLFLTVEQAMAYSGLSETLLKRLVNEHQIFAFERDNGYKISRKSLDALAEIPPSGYGGNGKKRRR